MPMALSCPACKSNLDAPADADRAEILCPKCATPVPIPAVLVPVAAIIETPLIGPTQRAIILEDERDLGRPLEKEERFIALLAHLLGLLISFFVDPLFAFAGPLIVLLVKGKESPFVRHHAKEALNYQITVAILSLLFGGTFFALI